MKILTNPALELDERFGDGAIHTFLITYEMSRRGRAGDPVTRACFHFDRAVELSQQRQSSPLLAMPEVVAVARQDRTMFEALLYRALAIDPDADPEQRLANLIHQRRARWLLRRTELFIVD